MLENKQEILISREGLELRALKEDDLVHTLDWRNNDEVRSWFINDEFIKMESHRSWFEYYLSKKNDLVLIGFNPVKNERVCQVAIYNIDTLQATAEIGRFISNPRTSGQGYVKKSMKILVDFAFTNLGLEKLYLEVKQDNRRAISLYEALGFGVISEEGQLIKMAKCRKKDS